MLFPMSNKQPLLPPDELKALLQEEEAPSTWMLASDRELISWSNASERLAAIRAGIPYDAIAHFSEQLQVPIKRTLSWLHMPQTTYNKNKASQALLSSGDSERLVLLTELIALGNHVFNGEKEKFKRWLMKPNLSLGGLEPLQYFDTVSGILEVKNALHRLDSGNFA